jgi:hypothetical protein
MKYFFFIFFGTHKNARNLGTGKLDKCGSLSVNVSFKLF